MSFLGDLFLQRPSDKQLACDGGGGGIAKDHRKGMHCIERDILHGNRTSTKRVVNLTHLSWRCQSSHGRRHYLQFLRIELGSSRSFHSFGGHTCTSMHCCGRRLDVLPNLPDGIIYVVVGGVVTLTLPLLNQVSKGVAHGLVECTYV